MKQDICVSNKLDAAYFCALELDAEKDEKKKVELVKEQKQKEVIKIQYVRYCFNSICLVFKCP